MKMALGTEYDSHETNPDLHVCKHKMSSGNIFAYYMVGEAVVWMGAQLGGMEARHRLNQF